jgi:acyl-homoserine lactone acylase PvdQ
LVKKMGQDPALWQWGKLHRVTMPHPFGILVSTFNLGPFPIGGVRKFGPVYNLVGRRHSQLFSIFKS